MAVFALVVKNLQYRAKGFDIPVDHYAIFNDETETVIHNSPDNPGVAEVSLDSFWEKYFPGKDAEEQIQSGKLVVVPAEQASATIWQRAKQKVGSAYDKMSYNCEHFTRWCFEGTAMSTQVQNAVVKGVGAVSLAGLAGYGAYKLFKWLNDD